MTMPYKKILSLDGGGAWALIQACALADLYEETTDGHEILKEFDLVIANSGGSLVAGALAIGLSPGDIRDQLFLDENQRRKVFVDKWDAFLTRSMGIGPRYQTPAKLKGLQDILTTMSTKNNIDANTRLDQLPNQGLPDFVITSFDYDRLRAVYFRSNVGSRANSDPGPVPPPPQPPTLAEALHASSNAPVNYFDAPAVFQSVYKKRRFWDGGVAGLNNPVLDGVIEAIVNGTPVEEIKVLSIGTASVMLPDPDEKWPIQPPEPLALKKTGPGVVTDLKKLATAIVDDPPDAASYIAYQVLHGGKKPNKDRLIRFNPLVQPNFSDSTGWTIPSELEEGFPEPSDTVTAFETLVNMEMDAVKQEEVDLIHLFCKLWLQDKVPNQPIQSTDKLGCYIGQRFFSGAKLAAKLIGLC